MNGWGAGDSAPGTATLKQKSKKNEMKTLGTETSVIRTEVDLDSDGNEVEMVEARDMAIGTQSIAEESKLYTVDYEEQAKLKKQLIASLQSQVID